MLPGLSKNAVGGDLIDGQCFRWDTRETNINYERVQLIRRLLIPPDMGVSDGVHAPPSVSGLLTSQKVHPDSFCTWTQDPPRKSFVCFIETEFCISTSRHRIKWTINLWSTFIYKSLNHSQRCFEALCTIKEKVWSNSQYVWMHRYISFAQIRVFVV